MENRVESDSCHFRRFIRRHLAKDDAQNQKITCLGASMASTSGKDDDPFMSSEEFVSDESNLLSLHPWIFKKERYLDGMNVGVKTTNGLLRSRRPQRFCFKPVDVMGNYITPFTDNVDVEEYVLSSPPNSPSPRFRPFVVTDGSRIISKSSFGSFGLQPENGLCIGECLHNEADGVSLGAKRAVTGVPLLPDARRLRRKSSELQHESVKASTLLDPCKVSRLEGSHDGMLPFVIGINIGMISALLLKRKEVDELNKLLKQSEDLVQDLQEELEMNDSFSVKELAYGTYESQNLKHWNSKPEDSTVLAQNHNMTPHSASPDEQDHLHLNKAGGNSESLRKIEAELEAELERLEQNINDCSLEQGMSHLGEFDSDLIADVVHGELRSDNLAPEIQESQPKTHDDTGTASTTYNANYSVSPKELSLRLHHVIQSRLEARIEELETELQQSQRQLQVMEAERQKSRRTLSNSDMGFSSSQESPQAMHMNNALVHPYCLNLAGDALDAYEEAYHELTQVTGKEESQRDDGYKSNSSRRSLPWDSILWSQGSSGTPKDEDEDGESGSFSDEEGKALIQRLVEKTKRGSSGAITAQRMLLLMDDE